MAHQIQRQQAHDLLKQREIDQALFANPASVNWLTGFAPPPQVVTSERSGQLSAGLVHGGALYTDRRGSAKGVGRTVCRGTGWVGGDVQWQAARSGGGQWRGTAIGVLVQRQGYICQQVGVERTFASDLIGGVIQAERQSPRSMAGWNHCG